VDAIFLSRLQFALTIMFHYLFPPLTIGMGVVIVYLEAMYLRRREPVYETAARFWTQLFAVSFAVGVASGIVMEFQFGTNWAAYSRFVGDVFGAALAAEGIFAFFLESGFLAILVFGWERVSPRFHFIGSIAVAGGSIFSAIWIIVANSWQQTPAGSRIVPMMENGAPVMVNGAPVMRAEMIDFWGVVFNPSTLNRLTHTLIGAFILGGFFIMSISAWYILKGRHLDFARRSFTGALIFATIFSLAALVSGDFNARMVAWFQPVKMAAMEGHFQTGPADLTLIGYPSAAEEKVVGVAIPGGLSLLLHGNQEKPVLGLDAAPREYWPPVAPTFFSFHIMVGLGVLFIAVTLCASFLRWRGRLFEKRWLMWVFVFAVIGPFAANQLGWVAAEVGRQPWSVHPEVLRAPDGEPILNAAGQIQYRLEQGLLTSDAVSEVVSGGQVLGSIVMFSLIYALLFAVWIYVLNHKIQTGPIPVRLGGPTTRAGIEEAAASRTLHEDTMSEAKDERDGEGRE
jgi:cytochrome d ubiquinol oxidase subunit I